MPEPSTSPKLVPLIPLGGPAPRRERIGDVTLTEITDRALASVAVRAGQEQALGVALSSAFGLALPPPPGIVRAGAFRLFSSAQGQWMLEAPLASHEDIAGILAAAVGGAASVTEQTDGWARLDLDGPDLPRLFERLCPIDLRGRPGPLATRCLIEHVGSFVLREEAGGVVTVLAPRSMAASLWHAVEAAARAIE